MRAQRVNRVSSGILEAIIKEISKSVHLENYYPLYVTLAACVANHFKDQAPVWLMLVGPSSCGKSLMLSTASKIIGVTECGSMTGEAAFISAQRGPKPKSGSGHAHTATGGILAGLIPMHDNPHRTWGILTAKDFTTVVSKQPERRLEILACFREIADGSWTRTFGSDGGGSVTWSGKAGFIGAVTPIIDEHYSVIQSMGDRWIYWRYPKDESQYAIVNTAITRAAMPGEGIADTVAAHLYDAGLREGMEHVDDMTAADRDRLIKLTSLLARCRASIKRNQWDKDDFQAPQCESPARVTLNLLNLYRGLTWLGIAKHDKWKILYRLMLDSLPYVRATIIKAMLKTSITRESMTAPDLANIVQCGGSTASYALQDLRLVGVVESEQDMRTKRISWRLSDDTVSVLGRVRTFIGASEEEFVKSKLQLDD